MATLKLIDRLIADGYSADGNLSRLLQNLDIHESPDDVIELLDAYDYDYDISPIIKKLGIERALMICDELCAPEIVSRILLQNLPLTRVMENHIINSHEYYKLHNMLHAFNNGYKIIPNYDINSHIYCTPITDTQYFNVNASIINNASNNGLFTRSMVASIINGNDDILPHILDDIIYVNCFSGSSYSNTILLTCKNIESIAYIYGCDLKKSPSVKNIKSLRSQRITDDELKLCTNLRRLYLCDNKNIFTCAPFSNTLRILDVSQSSNSSVGYLIGDYGLSMCKKIKSLNVAYNARITTCEPFAHSLIILNASRSGITDKGLVFCTRIKKLYANDNARITTCEPFANTLKYLEFNAYGGITNSGIAHCYKLKTLHIGSNTKINTIKHFLLLERFTYKFLLNSDMEKEIKTFKNLKCN